MGLQVQDTGGGEGIELQATCTWGCRGGLYVARCEGGWCGVRVGSVVCLSVSGE